MRRCLREFFEKSGIQCRVKQQSETMRKQKYQKRKVVYADGYDHYDKHRTVQVIFLVNEAERAALDDLMAVLGVKNMSDFIRGQVFRAFNDLNAEQKTQLKEVRQWRKEMDGEGSAG